MNLEQLYLTKIAEEAAEVSKEALKCAQFGCLDVEPGTVQNNIQRLRAELTDLSAVVEMLLELSPDLCFELDHNEIDAKKQKVRKYALYAADCGRVQLNEDDLK